MISAVNHISVKEMIERVKVIGPTNRSLVFIAISGFGGSGKSTLASKVRDAIDGSEIIPIDDFIVRAKENVDEDWATFDRQRLRTDVLDVAKPGQSLSYKVFNSGEYVNGQGGKLRSIIPERLIIVEGCGILHPTLMSYFDYSVWIDCPIEIAVEMAKSRDKAEGHDNDSLWDNVWSSNDQRFFKKYRPDLLSTALVEDWTTSDLSCDSLYDGH